MIQVTNSAAEKIKANLAHRGHGVGIRVGVNKTGCSGLAYVLEYVDEIGDNDTVHSFNGATVVVNKNDLLYITGLTVDWGKEGLNEGFIFVNPNEQGRCGCGKSFTI